MTRPLDKSLADPTVVAVAVRGVDWPRSMLAETRVPDAWIGLMEKRDARRWLVPSGEAPRADDGDCVTLVRNRPIVVPVEIAECPASCGNVVSGTCELLVRWPARDDELAALRRSLLRDGELTLGALARAVCDGGAGAALRRFLGRHTAAELIREDRRSDALAAIREEMQRFCFECGASIEAVASLRLASATLARREALERDAAHDIERIKSRELVEHAAVAATQRRLVELSAVMEKLQTAAKRGGDEMQWHELLPALSPAERGRLLENLWRVTPDRHATQAIVAIAGDECVWLNPADAEQIIRRVHVSADLGGVRSVSFDAPRRWLLVGAATGVRAIHADDGEVTARFAVPDAPATKTGFNSAAIIGERVYATHSQLGVWSWALHGDAAAVCILRPENGVPRTIRSICAAADGRVLFAADDCVYAHDPSRGVLEVVAAADDTIHCVASLEHELFVGVADGKLLRLDLRQPEDWWVPYRSATPIESVQPRRWSDLVELVVPGGPAGVCGVYSEENVVTRLLETATPTRRAWAADDILVALNDRRDRLTVMNAASADRRGRDVVLARTLGGSIQDACLVTTSNGTAPCG